MIILYDKQYLKCFRYGQSMRINCSEYLHPFPYLKHLEAIDPSFVTITKLSSNEIREAFCEVLK